MRVSPPGNLKAVPKLGHINRQMREEALGHLFTVKPVTVDIRWLCDFDAILPLLARHALRVLRLHKFSIDNFYGAGDFFDKQEDEYGAPQNLKVFQLPLTTSFPGLKQLKVILDAAQCLAHAIGYFQHFHDHPTKDMGAGSLMQCLSVKWLAKNRELDSFKQHYHALCAECVEYRQGNETLRRVVKKLQGVITAGA